MIRNNPVITGVRIIFALTCVGALIGGVWIGLAEHAFAEIMNFYERFSW